MTRPEKHSLTLSGHRTSVSLEPEFWQAFREIASGKNMGINALATEVDDARGVETGLASAIRLYVLACYREALPNGWAERTAASAAAQSALREG